MRVYIWHICPLEQNVVLVSLVTMVTTVNKELCNKTSKNILSSYLAQIFFVTVCINEKACCYGNIVTMAKNKLCNNSGFMRVF